MAEKDPTPGKLPKKARSPLWYLLPFAVIFLALGVVLFFVHPLAPLLLVASLVIQLPIVLGLTKTSLTAGYRDRAFERKQKYNADGDAEAWLAGEAHEAGSAGHKYWSRAARALCVLNRAEPLALLGRGDEAAELLATIEPAQLNSHDRARFDEIVALVRGPEPSE